MSSFVGQSEQGIAATENSAHWQHERGDSPEAIDQGNNEATATGGESFNDSGYFEDEELIIPGADYKDFQLFHDDLPEIDPDTDKFFADADAAIQQPGGFSYPENDDSCTGFDGCAPSQNSVAGDDAFFNKTIHEVTVAGVSTAVLEALENYDILSQSSYIPPLHPQDADVVVDPLLVWVGDDLRHEHISYRLSQLAPFSPESQP